MTSASLLPQPILILPAFLTTTALKCIFIVGLEFVEFPFESCGYNRVARVCLVSYFRRPAPTWWAARETPAPRPSRLLMLM